LQKEHVRFVVAVVVVFVAIVVVVAAAAVVVSAAAAVAVAVGGLRLRPAILQSSRSRKGGVVCQHAAVAQQKRRIGLGSLLRRAAGCVAGIWAFRFLSLSPSVSL
jgi:hypothetical protein